VIRELEDKQVNLLVVVARVVARVQVERVVVRVVGIHTMNAPSLHILDKGVVARVAHHNHHRNHQEEEEEVKVVDTHIQSVQKHVLVARQDNQVVELANQHP